MIKNKAAREKTEIKKIKKNIVSVHVLFSAQGI